MFYMVHNNYYYFGYNSFMQHLLIEHFMQSQQLFITTQKNINIKCYRSIVNIIDC